MKKRFKKVLHVKPPSSRKDSAEMYVVAIGYKDKLA
jgi:23S rRNA (uridine2552-2'-O)-methyltransferase